MNVLERRIWKSSIRLNQVTPLSDIHCASFDVGVRDLGHHKVPALSPRSIWHVGNTLDLEDIVYSPHRIHRSLTWWLIDVCGTSAIARSSPREDHHWALAARIRQVPPDWKRPVGRPSHTWLRAIEADLGPLNFGLATAWKKATTRDEWRHNYCGHSNAPAEYALKERKNTIVYNPGFALERDIVHSCTL